jgi:hypothetical protein
MAGIFLLITRINVLIIFWGPAAEFQFSFGCVTHFNVQNFYQQSGGRKLKIAGIKFRFATVIDD